MPQVLTANRLDDGEVVYLATGNAWVTGLAAARVLSTREDGEAALEAGREAERRRVVVHPYLFDVTVDAGAIRPVKMREVIRAAGPTVRRDLGKQAVA